VVGGIVRPVRGWLYGPASQGLSLQCDQTGSLVRLGKRTDDELMNGYLIRRAYCYARFFIRDRGNIVQPWTPHGIVPPLVYLVRRKAKSSRPDFQVLPSLSVLAFRPHVLSDGDPRTIVERLCLREGLQSREPQPT